MDNVLEIREREQKSEWFWLIRAHNGGGLAKWRRPQELKKMVQFVVLDLACSAEKQPYPVIQRSIDISATEIRNRVASGLSIRYLVPRAVEEIIRRENLYRESAT